nr:uncharacterized protein LOC127336566 [Lolium perenne]
MTRQGRRSFAGEEEVQPGTIAVRDEKGAEERREPDRLVEPHLVVTFRVGGHHAVVAIHTVAASFVRRAPHLIYSECERKFTRKKSSSNITKVNRRLVRMRRSRVCTQPACGIDGTPRCNFVFRCIELAFGYASCNYLYSGLFESCNKDLCFT